MECPSALRTLAVITSSHRGARGSWAGDLLRDKAPVPAGPPPSPGPDPHQAGPV